MRLAFPIDLAIHQVVAIEKRDTLFALNSLRLNVKMWPLLQGKAVVDGFGAYGLNIDTKAT